MNIARVNANNTIHKLEVQYEENLNPLYDKLIRYITHKQKKRGHYTFNLSNM